MNWISEFYGVCSIETLQLKLSNKLMWNCFFQSHIWKRERFYNKKLIAFCQNPPPNCKKNVWIKSWNNINFAISWADIFQQIIFKLKLVICLWHLWLYDEMVVEFTLPQNKPFYKKKVKSQKTPKKSFKFYKGCNFFQIRNFDKDLAFHLKSDFKKTSF